MIILESGRYDEEYCVLHAQRAEDIQEIRLDRTYLRYSGQSGRSGRER
jgi:hypothetical protein